MTDNTVNIPNIHPCRRTSFGSYIEDNDNNSIKECIGSVARTSMVHMAENVMVGENLDDDSYSTYSYSSLPRTYSRSRRDSEGTVNEATSLLHRSMSKMSTAASVFTVADTYQDHHPHIGKKSSFLQSVFNCINILIGVGVLALPLGFKNAGWSMGMVIFIFCFGLTNYTAKLLVKCLDHDSNSRTYGDMGASAFGMKGRVFISSLFITELTTCSVALVVLLSDGIESLFPGQNYILIRVISYLILTPTLFIPVRHLSYTSLLGILSIFSLIAVILYDGLSKPNAPGSLHEMADTDVMPPDWTMVPMSFGLIMAGFAGHAVFPTIYRDMKSPTQYNRMVDLSYIVTAIVYLVIAASGYAMFGSATMQEITQNIMLVPEYNQTINKLAVWLIAMNPVAKYGLTLSPVILSTQIGLYSNPAIEAWSTRSKWRQNLLNTIIILLISTLIVLLAVVLPNFDQVMSLVGALFSFTISGIFPVMCNLKLFKLSKWEALLNWIIIIIASLMAISGTIKSIF